MSLITRPRTHCLILAIVAAIVLPVRALLKSDYANERRSIETKGRKDRTRELLAQWNSLKYSPASSGNLTQAVLGRINWAGLQITEVQKTKLKHRLGELFNYLQNPTFEEYYRLKTEGLDWKFELNNQLPKSLRPSAFLAERRAASDPRELARSFWDAMNKETPEAPDKITAICLEHIAMVAVQTNSPKEIISG